MRVCFARSGGRAAFQEVADAVSQVIYQKRFAQKGAGVRGLFRVAAHQEYPDAGALGDEDVPDLPTVHPRHADIGQEQMDFAREGARYLQGSSATGRDENGIALGRKNSVAHLANQHLVFGDQHDLLVR